MSDTMSLSVRFAEMQEGMLAGLWPVPDGGFEWGELGEPSGFARFDCDDKHPHHAGGPWLIPRGEGRRRKPLIRPKRLESFIRLGRSPTEQRVLDFAKRHGWLGETVTHWLVLDGGTVVPGESFADWVREAQRVAVLWDIWEIVKRGDEETAKAYVSWEAWGDEPEEVSIGYHYATRGGGLDREATRRLFRDPPIGSRHGKHLPPRLATFTGVIANQSLNPDVIEDWTPREALGPLRFYVCREVNKALRGHVNMAVLPRLGSIIRYVPDSLRAAIYVEFATALAGGRPQRECQNPRCRLPFTSDDRRQRYCDRWCQGRAAFHRRKAQTTGSP